MQPSADFNPNSWQDVPKHYRVIEYVGNKQFRGRADAWRFVENKTVLDQLTETDCDNNPNREIKRWAVVID